MPSPPAQADMIGILVSVALVYMVFLIVRGIVKGIQHWQFNNAQPILSVQTTMAAKRRETHSSSSASSSTGSINTYYATFTLPDDSRREFFLDDIKLYDSLAEGERGTLTYQGDRFKGFVRG